MYIDNQFGDARTLRINAHVDRESFEKVSVYAVGVSPIEIAQGDVTYQVSIPFLQYDKNGNLTLLEVPDEVKTIAEVAFAMVEDFKLHGDLDLSKLRYRIGTSDLRLWKESIFSDLRWHRYRTGEEAYNFANLSPEERLRLHQRSVDAIAE